ncbi:hypothetical protein C3747_66g103 [Trypanosoma cruzi]|uniref:C3H1-type domain-containing protein n=2 Tax=Trypanosoma cruzi TaxID=5693 RepID=Q4DDW1_TRYCC|nr:hypothetical protein, conserved [Trypanosoma cruzi]EAN90716.1 hypothetical protein, conserved [Trypanosoma cruzi]PWV10763.1 hypothetical protein C3747_66g103 [Trypanosoma cruzi]RNC47461.1 hypothetical protein TcCL_NonESM02651 [Trypanosoma cruzi]|eukprot:XP_812567.1 hypothetical protein [Trypanosoma cruzi strain CL Brener]
MASVAGGVAAGPAPPPYHSTGAVKTNYVVEHAAPSAVCLVRKIQTSPYQPLPSEQVQSVTLPNLLSLRSPPHVAHQALMDFYFAMNGHCGINCSDPSSLDLITVAVHARNAGGSGSNTEIHSKETPRPHAGTTPPYYHAAGSLSTTPLTSAMPNNDSKNSNMLFLSNETPPVIDGGMYTHSQQQQQQQSNSAPSVLGTSIIPPSFTSSSSEDYRLSQIRRNERHVNNALYGKVCAFFNTREGCRRGPYCHFLHIGKGGGGSAGNGGGAAPQQFY